MSEKGECCRREVGERSWKFLKRRLKELGIAGQGGVQRTKADCLQICDAGPVNRIGRYLNGKGAGSGGVGRDD